MAEKPDDAYYRPPQGRHLRSWCIACEREDKRIRHRERNFRRPWNPSAVSTLIDREARAVHGSIDRELAAVRASEPYRRMMEACENVHARLAAANRARFPGAGPRQGDITSNKVRQSLSEAADSAPGFD